MTTISDIRRIVCQRYGVSFVDLDSHRHDAAALEARYVGMWLARFVTTASLTEIGARFGGRDRTTVRNALISMEKRVSSDDAFGNELRMLRSALMPAEPGEDHPYQPVIPGVYAVMN